MDELHPSQSDDAAPSSGLDELSSERLLTLFYDLLHDLAQRQMRASDHRAVTIQPTALIHEAYERLVKTETRWTGEGHFFSAAANAMRQVLVEHARRRQAQRRGGGLTRLALDDAELLGTEAGLDVLELDEALEQYRELDERGHRVVLLRCYAGLSVQEVADELGFSLRTVKREWQAARLWLLERLSPSTGDAS